MEENKIPSAEEYLKNSETYDEEYTSISLHDAEQRMIEFTKLHVKAALEMAAQTQQLKYYAGESGYLTREDWKLVYPEELIK